MLEKNFISEQIRLKIAYLCYKSGITKNYTADYLYDKVISAIENDATDEDIFLMLTNNGISNKELLSELLPHLHMYSECIKPDMEKRKQKLHQKNIETEKLRKIFEEEEKLKTRKKRKDFLTAILFLASIVFLVLYYYDFISSNMLYISLFGTAFSIVIFFDKILKKKPPHNS